MAPAPGPAEPPKAADDRPHQRMLRTEQHDARHEKRHARDDRENEPGEADQDEEDTGDGPRARNHGTLPGNPARATGF